MAAQFNLEDLAKLKSFVEFVAENPTILNLPELDFFKKLIVKLGGVVPDGTFQMPAGAKCPFGGDVKSESKPTTPPAAADEEIPEMEAESEESDVELDMEANNSQPILEPIYYVDEKSTTRKLSTKKRIKRHTISSNTRNNRTIKTQKQIKLEYDGGSGGDGGDNENREISNSITTDPLFTPKQQEVKCQRNDEKLKPEIYFDQDDDDEDYFMEEYGEDDKERFQNSDDDDDKPLILLTEKSPSRTYKKKQKTPRLHNCLETCKHKCTTKYDRQQRLDIFDFYWHLSERDKVKFIRKHIRKPVIRRFRCTKFRNNCCYFLRYYKIGNAAATSNKEREKTQSYSENNNSDDDDDEHLTKVCRKFFDGTLKISEREIKDAFKDYELKSEKIIRPLRDTKNEQVIKLADEQSQQYLDPETGDLSDTKPKKKRKRRRRCEPPPERFPKPINCAVRCKFKCHEKFSEVERKQICDIFWSLDFKRRKDFILSRIETTDVKTPITPAFRKTSRPMRSYQTKFYLRSGLKGDNIRVCKHFILNTLGTSRWFIENAIEFADKTTGAYTGSDRRKTHTVHNKISEERRQTIRDDINTYPFWIPNKKSKTKYLHFNLSIIKMYEAYKNKCLAEDGKYVSQKYYYRVFHEDFQLLFLKNPHPKKGLGFLLSNPHISNYTGEEVGGQWIDYKGNNLDMRLNDPAKRLNSLLEQNSSTADTLYQIKSK